MEVIKIKSAKYRQSDLSNNFNQLTNETIAPGSVIDLYNTATSKVYEDLYLEIENNKNQKFKTTVYFDIPYEDTDKSIYDGSIVVEKNTNFNFYRYR